MKIENQEALKKWLIKILNPIFEGDSDKLALYIVALVKKVENDEPSRQRCIDDLEVFLEPNTHSFVDKFFDALFNKTYLQADIVENSSEKSGEDERKKEADQRRESKSQRSRLSRDYQEIDVSNRASRAGSHSRRRKNRSRTRTHGMSRSSSSSSSSISPVRRSRSRSPYSRSRSRSPGQIVDKKQRGEPESFEHNESRLHAQSGQMSIKVQSSHFNNQYGNKRRVQLNKNGQPRYQKGANYSQRMQNVNMQSSLNDNVYTPSPIQPSPQSQSIQRQMGNSNRPRNLVSIVTSGNEDDTQDQLQQRGVKRTFDSANRAVSSESNNQTNTFNNSIVYDVNSDSFSGQQANTAQTQSQQHGLLPTPPQYIPSSRNQGQFQTPTPQNTILILRKIPASLNTVDKMRQHFSKFGNILDIQCHYDNLSDAALVQFSSNTEAFAAYKSPQPVFNNRFIRLYWLSSYLKQQQNQQNQQITTQSAPQSPAIGEPSLKKPLKDRLSFPGHTDTVTEGLNKENLVKPTSVNVSSTGTLTKTVYTSQITGEGTKSEELVKKPVSTETPESLAMAKKIQDENKKKALLLKLEVQKKARELMEQQLKDQKILMTKLELAKSVEEKTQILNLVKKLSEAIDKEKEILSKKIDDLEIEEGKAAGAQSPFGHVKSQKSSFVIPPVHQLKINNKRLNTTSFLKAGANKVVNKPASKSNVHQIAPSSLFTYSRVSVDRRPKQILITGVEAEDEKKEMIKFIKNMPDKTEIIENKNGEINGSGSSFLINFVTRREAEIAYAKYTRILTKVWKSAVFSWYKPAEPDVSSSDALTETKEEKSDADDQNEDYKDENKLENENEESAEQNDSLNNFLGEERDENENQDLKPNQAQDENNTAEENSDVFDSIFNDKE